MWSVCLSFFLEKERVVFSDHMLEAFGFEMKSKVVWVVGRSVPQCEEAFIDSGHDSVVTMSSMLRAGT
jgi:hypothetical protein